MNKESFESLHNYQPEENKIFINESLLLEKDDEGVFGTIIDRGLSFVPRAIRFKKAKKVMKKALAGYTNKAKNLIKKFSQSFKRKVDTIEKEYLDVKENKVVPLVKEGKREEAVKLMKEQLKELEDYKKQQMQVLSKGIEDVLTSYTHSIDKRIDNPGFVLNVELSEKGKGELKAKWQELVAIQNIKIDEAKTELIKSEGWKKLDDMISEITGFIESRRGGGDADVVFKVHDIVPLPGEEYLVRVHLRVAGGRPEVEEKGVLVGEDPESLEYGEKGIKKVQEVGTYQYNARPYKILIKASPEDFVRPYLKVKGKSEPYYGDAASLDVRGKSKEEKMRGDVTIAAGKKEEDEKEGKGIEGEKSLI
ncbi:MAG TPA: hypothetical protein VMW50_00375 [Dehalococcoidia bacterium]|nr:hypothetical protein [Dehalococcoidia bacterium]